MLGAGLVVRAVLVRLLRVLEPTAADTASEREQAPPAPALPVVRVPVRPGLRPGQAGHQALPQEQAAAQGGD